MSIKELADPLQVSQLRRAKKLPIPQKTGWAILLAGERFL
jgi:hypothetical protein